MLVDSHLQKKFSICFITWTFANINIENLLHCLIKYDWDAFKAKITALYPGADKDCKYTVVDLEILIDKQVHKPMQLRYQFGNYYCQFVTISNWLLTQHEISI